MSRVVRRLLLVTLGFVVAMPVALATMLLLGVWWGVQDAARHVPTNADEFDMFWNQMLGGFAFVLTIAPGLTLLPAIAAVVVGELANLRSWMYYTAGGGAACAAMPLFLTQQNESFPLGPPHFAILALAGAAAGFMYWLIAGRNA